MKFECQTSCGGKCCKIPEGQHTYVFLTPEDKKSLLKLTGKKLEEIAVYAVFNWTRFTKEKTKQWVLRQENEKCIFLKDGKCEVYEARPIQCRSFPFWPELFRNHKEWKKTTDLCPGIGKGKNYTEFMMVEKLKEQTDADAAYETS